MAFLLAGWQRALDHRWAPGHMSAGLDGELAPSAQARMARHLAVCPACRQLSAQLAMTVTLLRARGQRREPAPAHLVATVRARIGDPRGS